MRTKLFPLLVVCLVCFFSAKAQIVNESESSISFAEKTAEVRLVLENSGDAFDQRVELEILDAQDVIRARAAQNLRIKKGKETYKIPMPVGDLPATATDGVDWFRLRYRVADKTGIISLSQLIRDVFELRIAASERLFADEIYQVRVRAVHPSTDLPVKKVKIEGELGIDFREGSADDIGLTARAETDGEGSAILEFKIPANANLDDVDLTVKGSKNGIARDVYEDLNDNENGGRILLTTDKPMYQPAQDFKVRGLYSHIYHSDFYPTEAKNVYAESFKKQLAPVEAG